MTREGLSPLKGFTAWTSILLGGAVTAWIGFIAVVSIWEGFRHIDRSGSWMPIVGGTLVFGLSVWLYLRGARAIYRRLNRDESLDL